MKKVFLGSFLILSILAISLCGCGKYDDTSLDVTKIDVDKYISEVGNYTGINVETVAKLQVSEETVDEYFEYLLSTMDGPTVETEAAATSGNIVNIDYEGRIDGELFNGGSASNYGLTIGSGTFIEGFESGLIGHSKGETVVLNLKFPDNYFNTDIAGKDVEFTVKINSVNEMIPPTMSDELVVQFGFEDVNTVDDFRTFVLENLKKSADSNYENTLRDSVLSVVYGSTTFKTDEVPENLFNYYLEQVQKTDKEMASSYGVSMQEFVPVYYNVEYDEYLEKASNQAKIMTQDAMICEKIARLEKISVTDAEMLESMEQDATKYGYSSVDDFKASVDELDYKNYLIELKVVDKILETANVVDIEETYED